VLLCLGCSSTLEPPSGDPRLDLRHKDPRIRVLAAKETVLQNRRDLIPLLIENLSDRDGAVRLYAATALHKLTGKRFGYLPFGTPAERQAAVEAWREWYQETVAPPPAPPPASPSPGGTPPPAEAAPAPGAGEGGGSGSADGKGAGNVDGPLPETR
jgi:hypothetical protein